MAPSNPQTLTTNLSCPVCDSTRLVECMRITNVPVYCNVLLATRDEARQVARGDIDLVFCQQCGHLFNRAFEPSRIDYTQDYENSLHYSHRFQEYAESLAEQLIDRYALHNKTIVEIACGKGEFLSLLCARGENQGVGFDPSHRHESSNNEGSSGSVTFVRDYYREEHRDYAADLVVCRHALEHMHHPREFLAMLHRAIGVRRTPVFFEVPNAMFTLADLGIWDLIYEHCGYFTENSLREVFLRSGFRVCGVESVFGDQFLYIDAVPELVKATDDGAPPQSLRALEAHVERFASEYQRKVHQWQTRLRALADAGKRIVIWGAGSKGVTFLNALDPEGVVGYVVDINPYKHEKHVPGTGHRVVAPEFLRTYRPETIIVMNPLYAGEIRRQVAGMELDAELLVDETASA